MDIYGIDNVRGGSWTKITFSNIEKNILKKIDKKIVQDLREKIDKEIDEAFNFAEQSPFPDYNYHKLNFHSK